MLKDEIIQWATLVDTLDKEVDSYIKEHELPHIPAFDEIVNRKVLYTSYSNVIEIGNEVAVLSNRIINMTMMRSQLKRALRTEGYGPSVVASMNVIIDEVSDRVNILDKKLGVYKTQLDNQFRFYQSVQYILASPRLNTMD